MTRATSSPVASSACQTRLAAAKERFRRAVVEMHAAVAELQEANIEMATRARQEPATAPSEQMAYRAAQVAKQLGVTEKHVRNEIARGKLAAIKSGGALLVRRQDLRDYLAELDQA